MSHARSATIGATDEETAELHEQQLFRTTSHGEGSGRANRGFIVLVLILNVFILVGLVVSTTQQAETQQSAAASEAVASKAAAKKMNEFEAEITKAMRGIHHDVKALTVQMPGVPEPVAATLPVHVTATPQEACGFPNECPLHFDISRLSTLEEAHARAQTGCQSEAILETGGWCYKPDGAVSQPGPPVNDVEYLIPEHHVAPCGVWLDALATDLLLKPDGSCCYSVTEFGAGVGQYRHALMPRLPSIEYYAYDGAGNVEEFTNKYVRWIDLTLPLNFKRTDWVLCAEVGEHIPNKHEAQVIRNIHAHNCRGVILSWAIVGQGGNGHINVHSNEYLIKLFTELGYSHNQAASDKLRAPTNSQGSSNWYWFEGSSMVFDRIQIPKGCS